MENKKYFVKTNSQSGSQNLCKLRTTSTGNDLALSVYCAKTPWSWLTSKPSELRHQATHCYAYEWLYTHSNRRHTSPKKPNKSWYFFLLSFLRPDLLLHLVSQSCTQMSFFFLLWDMFSFIATCVFINCKLTTNRLHCLGWVVFLPNFNIVYAHTF